MKISIHQPSYWPWLGLLHKIRLSDADVILDNVNISKGSFQYRNQFLCNGNMLSYEYFIEVIGIQNFESACSSNFLTGLDCLQEALRIRGSIQLKSPNENHSLLKQTHHWKKNASLASKVSFLKLPYVKANGNRLNLGKTFRIEV